MRRLFNLENPVWRFIGNIIDMFLLSVYWYVCCLPVVTTGSGKGYYFSLGTLREIRWEKASRTSPYTLYEADGETKLLINQGKSYIGMVKPGTDVVYK